jgi:DNA-binding MarR family transcriptional regulator
MQHENHGLLIKQIHDAFGKRVNNALREDGLTLTQMRMLMELGENGGTAMPLKELEWRFGVAQPTVVGIVQRLESKGLVAGFAAPEDNRVKLVELTPAGEQFCENSVRAIKEMENRMTARLTEAERRDLLRMLRTVYENIK